MGADGFVKDEFVDAPITGVDHRGPAMVALLSETYGKEPFGLTEGRLRSRLASISADGACVAGGPEANHSSSKCAENFFRRVFPEVRPQEEWVLWDFYHCAEKLAPTRFRTTRLQCSNWIPGGHWTIALV